ncbi:CDGSH iron-sulfur domain-containing protein [Flexithrix dorotheae]|uniref:CDGSH iron-sulfur domain-containing protein n=1 Tax=Flexithrix dorotheae TaxID=70993 RepID=UPI0004764992|nr:CDGSH iron-sulfur domain-containing protein [Flexithrix dorotheae]
MNQPKIAQKVPYVMDIEPGTYFWCACGESKKQPYCDGSHKGTDFRPVKETVEKKKRVAWCGCKHSQKAPFCDGSHSKL